MSHEKRQAFRTSELGDTIGVPVLTAAVDSAVAGGIAEALGMSVVLTCGVVFCGAAVVAFSVLAMCKAAGRADDSGGTH